MQTTIDSAGRVVVPKAMREKLGLTGGTGVEIELRDGHIEIDVVPTAVRLVEEDGVWSAVADHPMQTLTAEQVRDVLEQVRR